MRRTFFHVISEKMKYTIIITLFLAFGMSLSAQEEMPLYEGPVPNSRDIPDPEQMVDRGPDNRAFHATAVPTLTVFRPTEPNGQAIVLCPGGGYVKTAFDKEGVLVARELIKEGITVFVLKYRIPQDSVQVNPSLAPLQDAQQAIRHVRGHAGEYGLSPDRIGIMGFSAGGHLAASAATRFQRMADSHVRDTTSVRPDFVILMYPVISFADELTHRGSRTHLLGENPTAAEISLFSADRQVSAASPPAFLVHAADDETVPVGNSLAYYQACLDQGVPAEMHLYPAGGHGFGLYNATTNDIWMERLKHWLEQR